MKFVSASRAIEPSSKGVSSNIAGEKNDCAIRAAVNVTGKDYQYVHDIFNFYGRKLGHSSVGPVWIKSYNQLGLKPMYSFGSTNAAKYEVRMYDGLLGIELIKKPGITIKKFLKCFPVGKFLCMSRNHAFAIIDGELIDHITLLINTRITIVFKA